MRDKPMPRTLKQLEDAILNSNSRVRAALLLSITEMLDDVVKNYARVGRMKWYARFAETRDLLWSALANDTDLDRYSSTALDLCAEVNEDLMRTGESMVYPYGPPASEVASALYSATAGGSPHDDVNSLLTAFACLKPIFFPNKKVWTSFDYEAFELHPSHLALQQGVDYLHERFVATHAGVREMRENARSIGQALAAIFPRSSDSTFN